MKFSLCILALVAYAVALPVEDTADDEFDWSKISPIDIYVEPENPADSYELPGGRVIGGTEVTRNSIPYQCAIVIDGSGFCGCSIIATNRVLTAAHCTIRASTAQVRAGAHAVNTNEATQQRVTVSSSGIVNHASYNPSTIANDVAVLRLPSSLSLNNNVRTISLAPASAPTYAGSTALLTGWGRTSDASNAISPVLRGVNLPVIANSACSSVFGSIVLASNICTSGAGNRGACNGDSGGPLVVSGVQVGVVSFGSARCAAGNPTAYARVSSFRNWISSNAGV